jgi:hypothetical protein
MTLKSCQQLAHQLASEVIRDSVPGKLAGTHQVGPQGLATFADQFHGQKAFERGLAEAIRAGTESNVAGRPDPAGTLNDGVGLPRIGDNLNFVALSQALDHLLTYGNCVSVAPERIDIQLFYLGELRGILGMANRSAGGQQHKQHG